jgi:hypothetical protein
MAMKNLKKLEINISDFREWLLKRGYDNLMGSENFDIYLESGLASLFFNNSSLLMSYIFNKLELPSERVNERVRFEIGKRVKEIKAGRDTLVILLDTQTKKPHSR